MQNAELLAKATIAEQKNVKLGKMGSWAMLFGDTEWYIPELQRTCKGTCGKHCKGCYASEDPRKSACYVAKSYARHTARENGEVGNIVNGKCSVKYGHAIRTIAMTEHKNELLESLDKQLSNKKEKFKIIRINESGELTCYMDLKFWITLARLHTETTFYVYTKNYEAVRTALKRDIIPVNFFINISVWHECGIKEWHEFKENAQIRAFVLVDDEWTKEKYAEHGLQIESMCAAYDSKGKMNHAVTCEKCAKCFSNSNKCCGCYEH